ncbi:unnamed protein product [Arabidopsis halleri]
MLVRDLKFHKAFTSLKECDRNYKSLSYEDECDCGERICDFLKSFSTITTYFGLGHLHHTSKENVKVFVQNLNDLYAEHMEKA